MTGESGQIQIASIGSVSPDVIETVERALHRNFDAPVARHTVLFDPRVAFDAVRKQYDSTRMLEALHREVEGDAKLLGITDLDLFVPVFTFVFGEAQLGGRVAIASLFRLRNGFYGLPDDEDLLVERLVKEAVHEVGHTFGLVHCDTPTCVMHASTAVEEVDVKGARLCRSCRSAIGI